MNCADGGRMKAFPIYCSAAPCHPAEKHLTALGTRTVGHHDSPEQGGAGR